MRCTWEHKQTEPLLRDEGKRAQPGTQLGTAYGFVLAGVRDGGCWRVAGVAAN